MPFPTPGDLLDQGIEQASLASPALAGRFFTTALTWKHHETASRRRLSLTWDHRVAAARAQKVANGTPPCTAPSHAFAG